MMKFYYIDDAMFEAVAFQEEIRHRFLCHLRKNQVKLILVSAAHKENGRYRKFLEECKNISIVRSPAIFDVDGICGTLHTGYAAIEGYPIQHAYSGTCVEFDEKEKKAKRIYLDMFVDHHEEENFDFLVEELEKAIQDKIFDMKKKKDEIN